VILLVNQHTVPIFIDIANAFAEAGEETILFTGHVETGGKPLSTKIKIVKSISYQRHSVVSRLLTWLIFSIHYFFYLLVTQRLTRILVVTNPPLAPLITGLIAGWRKLPYFILIYDLYPEAFVQARFLNSSHLLYRSWQNVNVRYFKTAKGIFTLSESMRKAASAYVDDSTKISVVHNWVDTDYVYPISKTENVFIMNNRLEGKTVVMYAGNMGLTHDLESVIEAARLLKNVFQLFFVFIGDGGKRKILEQLVNESSLPNVQFLPYQDEVNFPLAMAAADIGVVTLGVGAEGISVPSKTYINLAAGVCLLSIAPASSELSRLIDLHQVGINCEPGSPVKLAHAIQELVNDKSLLTRYQKNALKAALSYTSENAKEYVKAVIRL
jgi:glycosyltransferase involved in cell wall biosynthesis